MPRFCIVGHSYNCYVTYLPFYKKLARHQLTCRPSSHSHAHEPYYSTKFRPSNSVHPLLDESKRSKYLLFVPPFKAPPIHCTRCTLSPGVAPRPLHLNHELSCICGITCVACHRRPICSQTDSGTSALDDPFTPWKRPSPGYSRHIPIP